MIHSSHLHEKWNGPLIKALDQRPKAPSLASVTLKRRFFLCAGFLSIGIGILGIVLPILDTTPFMLLGAYCFAKSSPKWHRWLLSHPVFGEYIVAFQEKKGLTLKQKRRIAMTTTAMLSITAFLHAAFPVMRWIVGGIWLACMSFLYFSRTATSGPEKVSARNVSEVLERRTR